MHITTVSGNIPAHQKVIGADKWASIQAISNWVTEDGTPFAITLTPNSTREPLCRILAKLKRLSVGLAYGPRAVPRSCKFDRISKDKPRLVGFEEGQVDVQSDARIRHFHGLIGLRNEAEEHFCRDFLDRHWSDLYGPFRPNRRTYCLEDASLHAGGPFGWLRYATKRDAFVTVKEPIFIG